MMYQNNAVRMASNGNTTKAVEAAKTGAAGPLAKRLASIDGAAFVAALQTIARSLYMSAPRASDADRQFLQDIARGDQRVKMLQLQRLLAIAKGSTRPEHKVALEDLVRFHVQTTGEVLDPVVASDVETEAQGPADVDVRLFERHRDRPSKERALASLRRHYAALRTLIDSIESCTV